MRSVFAAAGESFPVLSTEMVIGYLCGGVVLVGAVWLLVFWPLLRAMEITPDPHAERRFRRGEAATGQGAVDAGSADSLPSPRPEVRRRTVTRPRPVGQLPPSRRHVLHRSTRTPLGEVAMPPTLAPRELPDCPWDGPLLAETVRAPVSPPPEGFTAGWRRSGDDWIGAR